MKKKKKKTHETKALLQLPCKHSACTVIYITGKKKYKQKTKKKKKKVSTVATVPLGIVANIQNLKKKKKKKKGDKVANQNGTKQ